MDNGTISLFNNQFTVAKNFLESDNQILWDLSHYIADNAIGKICMLELVEKKGKSISHVERLNYPTLINEYKREFPNIQLDFQDIIAQHTNGRNPFQHHISTTYLGIRKEQAEQFLSHFEDIMIIIDIFHPRSNFFVSFNQEIRQDLEWFIEKLENAEYKEILDKFYSEEFLKTMNQLFVTIENEPGSLILIDNSLILVLIWDKISEIQYLNMKEISKEEWRTFSIEKKLEEYLKVFKQRAKLIFGISL